MACRTIRQRPSYDFQVGDKCKSADLKNLLRIAKALNVDVARLLNTEVVNDDEI